jgi:hypothetical protein
MRQTYYRTSKDTEDKKMLLDIGGECYSRRCSIKFNSEDSKIFEINGEPVGVVLITLNRNREVQVSGPVMHHFSGFAIRNQTLLGRNKSFKTPEGNIGTPPKCLDLVRHHLRIIAISLPQT